MNSIYFKRSILKLGQLVFILISTLLLSKATVNAQTSTTTGWQQWEKIYSDSYMAVELQYYYSNSGCDPNGKQFKFRGRLTGQYRTTPLYVNFKTDFIDCDGNLYWKQNAFKLFSATGESVIGIMDESLDNRFPAASIDLSYYDVQVTSTLMSGGGFKAFPTSKDPTSVQGRNAIYYGEQTKLTVKGGQLGIGADWVWYKDSCGTTKIGTGPSIEIALIESGTYYVRAEGTNNTTNCATIAVKVDNRSTDPNLVQGKTEICIGTDAILTVSGGSLGLGAKWVWYADGCGSKKLGEGSSITISPTNATSYFVRAESTYNTTNCAKLTVNVVESSEEPTGITHNLKGGAVCQGEFVELKVKGGRLAKGGVWAWYSSSCGSSRIGSGESISHAPSWNTTYYVRAEGVCNSTDCASVPITVNSVSSSPSLITVPEKIFKGKKATLSVTGGSLGKEAQWAWYKGTCGSGEVIGRGTSITIRPRNKATFAVRAEGACNITNCATTLITPLKTHKFDKTYNAGLGNRKFLHFGFGFGAEWQNISGLANATSYDGSGIITGFGEELIDMSGYGLNGEIVFHPFIKEYLSIGFMASGAIGAGLPKKEEGTIDVSYFYQRFNLGSELAFGFKGLKFLFKLDKTVQPNEYSEEPNTGLANGVTYEFDRTLKTETISSGFRFGRYTRYKDGKRGDCVDLTYRLTRYLEDPLTTFDFEQYSDFSNWFVGTGFTWWKQSKFKLQFDIGLNVTQGSLDFGDLDFDNARYNLSFIWNRNLFY
jgi:hypothetical protein